MPQRRKKDPSYRLHKPSGQAIVTLPDGFGGRHDVYLGKFDTAESWEEHNRVLTEWKVNGRRLPTTVAPAPELTIHQLILAYYRFAESYYVKDGKPTSEVNTIAQAMRFLKRLYGNTAAKDFGSLALKAAPTRLLRCRQLPPGRSPCLCQGKCADLVSPATPPLPAEFRNSGGAARFLFAMPPKRKKVWTEADLDPTTAGRYARLLRGLHALEFDRDANDRPVPIILQFTPAARQKFIQFFGEWAEKQYQAQGDLAAAFSKLEGYAIRFALIHHCALRTTRGPPWRSLSGRGKGTG
jgi:hypothetical protein